MSTIGTVFAISFCLSRDSWGNGQLVASVFLHSFLPVLFCLVWTHQWEILLIVYFMFHHILRGWNLLLIMRSEVVLPLLVMISSFPCSLPVSIACDARLYTVASEHMPYSQRLHWHTLWLCATTFGFPISLIFFSWVWILCFVVCSTCFYLRPVNVSVDINVFFRPVCCILVGYYVISSILLPYLPSVCVRLILGAMGTTESHWFLVHWFTQQSQRMGMYVHSFGTRYNLQFLSSSKTCLKFLLCILQDLHVF
jgi:hypothetical protein